MTEFQAQTDPGSADNGVMDERFPTNEAQCYGRPGWF